VNTAIGVSNLDALAKNHDDPSRIRRLTFHGTSMATLFQSCWRRLATIMSIIVS